MRLAMRTNLAMRTLMYCAAQSPNLVRRADIATCCGASEAHIGIVVHRLQRVGYLTTLRGRSGGVLLARPASDICVAEIVQEFEVDSPFAGCDEPAPDGCPLRSGCRLRPVFDKALAAFYAVLADVTLSDLVDGNSALSSIFAAASPEPLVACQSK